MPDQFVDAIKARLDKVQVTANELVAETQLVADAIAQHLVVLLDQVEVQRAKKTAYENAVAAARATPPPPPE